MKIILQKSIDPLSNGVAAHATVFPESELLAHVMPHVVSLREGSTKLYGDDGQRIDFEVLMLMFPRELTPPAKKPFVRRPNPFCNATPDQIRFHFPELADPEKDAP